MVFRSAESISGCERGSIRIGFISSAIDWPGEGRFQQTFVAYADRPAMFGQLHLMNGEDDLPIQKSKIGHFEITYSDALRITWRVRAKRYGASS